MRRIAGAMAGALVLWLTGCASDDLPDPAPADPKEEPEPPVFDDPVEEALHQAGFRLGRGLFHFGTMEDCCAPGANCWGNNPSTPYGSPALPPSPGQLVHRRDVLWSFGPLPSPELTRSFQLRPDEAVVILGDLPPRARYMSYRSYVAERLGAPTPVVGSLGPSLNHQVLGERMGVPEIWGRRFALITSAHVEIEQRVVGALQAAGYAPHEIHFDRIPPGIGRLGIGLDGDTFFGLMRVALYDDPVAGDAFQADPGYQVLRLTPEPFRVPATPHPLDPLPERGTGQTEAHFEEAVDALEGALLQGWPGLDAAVAEVQPYWVPTALCAWELYGCTGDIRDRFVALMPEFTLPDDDGFAVFFGVNHAMTGKATYASVSVQTVIRQTGLESFTSDEMPGTATPWIPAHPAADALYAVFASRRCEGLPEPCIEVPSTCPGPALDEPVKVTVRAYLEPETGAAPLPEELVLDRMILFRPEE